MNKDREMALISQARDEAYYDYLEKDKTYNNHYPEGSDFWNAYEGSWVYMELKMGEKGE